MAMRIPYVQPVNKLGTEHVSVRNFVHHCELCVHEDVVLRREAFRMRENTVVRPEAVRRHDEGHLVEVVLVERQVVQLCGLCGSREVFGLIYTKSSAPPKFGPILFFILYHSQRVITWGITTCNCYSLLYRTSLTTQKFGKFLASFALCNRILCNQDQALGSVHTELLAIALVMQKMTDFR